MPNRPRKYLKTNDAIKQAVVSAGDNWQIVAAANNVPKSTARNWLKREIDDNNIPIMMQKGGKKHCKVTQEHRQAMQRYIEADCKITLKSIKAKLNEDFGLDICQSTVGNHLDGMLYTVKKLYHTTDATNSQVNKQKRKQCVEALVEYVRNGKRILYIDETNFNCWISRTQGRAVVGQRAVAERPSTRGANIHIIGAIEMGLGLIYYEIKQGSFRKENFLQWLINCTAEAINKGIPEQDLVLVIDNAPCHSQAENITTTYPNVTLLRLGPYSPALNPIEGCWSVIKAEIKRLQSENYAEFLNNPPRQQGQHRMNCMEAHARNALQILTQAQVMNFVNHCQALWPCVVTLEDIPVGE